MGSYNNYDDVLGRRANNSKIVFKEIERQQENRERAKAASVVKVVDAAQDHHKRCIKAVKASEKALRKIKQALKKYKKTGNAKYLAKVVG